MNEQLQGKLVEILSGIQSATKAAGDFALEQLPDIAQQYVTYGRVSLTIYVVFGIAGVIAMWVIALRMERSVGGFNKGMPTAVIGVLGGMLPGLLVVINASPMLLVWFAPKVWLLKELASLVK